MITPWGFLQMLLRGSGGSAETVDRYVHNFTTTATENPSGYADNAAIEVEVVPRISASLQSDSAIVKTEG